MKVRGIERAGVRLVECIEPITRLDDGLSLVAACAEHHSNRLLVDSANLPEAFFDLRSRFAGELIQKLQNYSIQLAVVFAADAAHGETFEAFLVEARRGRQFRAFTRREDAEAWLTSQ